MKDMNAASDTSISAHPLSSNWMLWFHLPQDSDWTINSYRLLWEFKTMEDTIAISETTPSELVLNGMLFIMRDGTLPMWEHKNNCKGGCFSYRVSNKNAYNVWKKLTYLLVGNTLSSNKNIVDNINGITISPKKNFCVIKIWMHTGRYQNPEDLNLCIDGIISKGAVYKPHVPN